MENIWLPCFTVDAAPITKAVLAAASAGETTVCQHRLLRGGIVASSFAMQPVSVLYRG